MRVWRVIGGLGSLLFAAPMVAAWNHPSLPPLVPWLSLAVLAVTLARPAWGLLAVGLLVPTTAYLHGLTRTELLTGLNSAATAEILITPFLLGAALRFAFGFQAPASRLARPALVLGVLIACSALVGLVSAQMVTTWPRDFVRDFARHMPTTYFDETPPFVPYHNAIFWIEGLTLMVFAERLLRAGHWAWPGVFVAGGVTAAMAAWIRLVEVAVRSDHPFQRALIVLGETRVSTLLKDPNAAGSMFALYLVPAVWLTYRAIRPPAGSPRWGAAAASGAASIVLALALQGTWSRAAYLGVIVALALLWLLTRRLLSRKTVAIGFGTAAALLALLVFLNPGSSTQASPATSMGIRLEMGRIAMKIAEEHPVFGAGLGEFKRESRSHITDDLRTRFEHTKAGENAHNNFLQILAELGALGLIAFLWMLASGARSIPPVSKIAPTALASRAIAGGLIAFLVSALAGHPFLTGEVYWVFCLALGAAVGLGGMSFAAPAANPWPRRLAIAAAALLIASVPARLWQLRYTDMRRHYFGAGRLMKDDEGVKYYQADARSRWFIPAESRFVEIPLRGAEERATPCQVQISIDQKPVNILGVDARLWVPATIALTPLEDGRQSRALDLLVSGTDCRVKVGEITTRD
jgi:hypothetical protein